MVFEQATEHCINVTEGGMHLGRLTKNVDTWSFKSDIALNVAQMNEIANQLHKLSS